MFAVQNDVENHGGSSHLEQVRKVVGGWFSPSLLTSPPFTMLGGEVSKRAMGRPAGVNDDDDDNNNNDNDNSST